MQSYAKCKQVTFGRFRRTFARTFTKHWRDSSWAEVQMASLASSAGHMLSCYASMRRGQKYQRFEELLITSVHCFCVKISYRYRPQIGRKANKEPLSWALVTSSNVSNGTYGTNPEFLRSGISPSYQIHLQHRGSKTNSNCFRATPTLWLRLQPACSDFPRYTEPFLASLHPALAAHHAAGYLLVEMDVKNLQRVMDNKSWHTHFCHQVAKQYHTMIGLKKSWSSAVSMQNQMLWTWAVRAVQSGL